MSAFLRPLLRAALLSVVATINNLGEIEYTTHQLRSGYSARDLNNHGEIVGDYRGTVQFAFYFDGNEFVSTGVGGGTHYSHSANYGINNNHFTVGVYMRDVRSDPTGTDRAVRSHPDVLLHPVVYLGSLVGPDGDSYAYAINDENIAVGESETTNATRRAVRFERDGSVTDLGTLGGSNSVALGINLRGDVIGNSQDSNGNWRAFLIPAGGEMIDLGGFGGTETKVQAINSKSEIVGSSLDSSGASRAFLYANGSLQDLGSLGGTNVVALDINDAGVIVGWSGKPNAPGFPFPFIKYPGQPMRDLGALASVPYPDQITSALAINNRNQILVRGFSMAGTPPSYLLTPGHFTLVSTENGPEVRLAAPPGSRVRIDSAITLGDWTPHSTNTVQNAPIIFSPPANQLASFYRAVVNDP